jgi:hypothetical protein
VSAEIDGTGRYGPDPAAMPVRRPRPRPGPAQTATETAARRRLGRLFGAGTAEADGAPVEFPDRFPGLPRPEEIAAEPARPAPRPRPGPNGAGRPRPQAGPRG